MAVLVHYSATQLAGSGKKGKVKKDEQGYYEVCLGALNIFNSLGHYYTEKGCRQLFDNSSSFKRRMLKGQIYGELGHPKRYEFPMTQEGEERYTRRMTTIDEKRHAIHIKDVWLDDEYAKKIANPPSADCIGIIGLVKPSGVYAEAAERALESPSENTAFSIRAFTQDTFLMGVRHRVLEEIFTWDLVGEPGLETATKYNTPATEEYSEIVFTPQLLRRLVASTEHSGRSMEDGLVILQDVIQRLERRDSGLLVPVSTNW